MNLDDLEPLDIEWSGFEDPKKARRQVREYLNGERETFDLEYSLPEGFPGRVLREVSKIPFGETRSYGEIAEKLGNAAVAVGQAVGKNPVPSVVPCHRVVGSDGIGGYRGGEKLKKRLLELEGVSY